jgi:hypothetical protein
MLAMFDAIRALTRPGSLDATHGFAEILLDSSCSQE